MALSIVDQAGKSIEKPSLLCRRGGQIDGQSPSAEEIEALDAAVGFAFLDENPRRANDARQQVWNVLTADNTEPFFWPVDVDAGYVTVTTGLMVRTLGGGYRISDAKLVIKPPLDLRMPLGSRPRLIGVIFRPRLTTASANPIWRYSSNVHLLLITTFLIQYGTQGADTTVKPKNTICLWFDTDAHEAGVSTPPRFRIAP